VGHCDYRVNVKGGFLLVTVIIEVNTVNKNGIETVLDLKKGKYVVFFTLINIRWFCTSPNVFCGR
jgi:hypothetical protein